MDFFSVSSRTMLNGCLGFLSFSFSPNGEGGIFGVLVLQGVGPWTLGALDTGPWVWAE